MGGLIGFFVSGKTIQCVALIAHLLTKGVAGPFLVVAPLATLPNWVREFEKWLPNHEVVRYHGPDREALLKGPLQPRLRKSPSFPFIVTSYEVSIRDQAKLEKLCEFSYIIVDEGHRLKNHRCTLLRSLKRLKAANRLLLTGTPIQNTLDEVSILLFDLLSTRPSLALQTQNLICSSLSFLISLVVHVKSCGVC